jgi:hypothetical protein
VGLLGPIAQSDEHDPPGLIGEFVPCVAAMVDEIVVGLEDPVGELSRMNGQTFSTGLQIPAHCGQSFRRIADSIPVIADSF